MKTTTQNERKTEMSKQETMIEVGVFDNSTSWGTIGTYKPGAARSRSAIRPRPQPRRPAMMDTTDVTFAGGRRDGRAVSPTWDVRGNW